jgi:hypothetical protein
MFFHIGDQALLGHELVEVVDHGGFGTLKVQLQCGTIKEAWPGMLTKIEGRPKKPDGGPSGYYDFPAGALTLNDLLEYKGDKQWLGDSFHLSNVVKAAWRWGDKEGTTKAYDARKFIYSGARLLLKYVGVEELRKTLQAMLDDPQFKPRGPT